MRPVLVAACLVVAACSKNSSAAPDGGAPSSSTSPFAHPCALLPRSDAEEILGSTDLHQEEEEPGPSSDAHCHWALKGARGFVDLRVQFPPHKDDFDRSVPDRVPLAGIGDRAYVQKRASWAHVDVLKGDRIFFVEIQQSTLATGRAEGPQDVRIQTITLARTVAARM